MLKYKFNIFHKKRVKNKKYKIKYYKNKNFEEKY